MTNISPDVITLQETNVTGNNTIKIDKRYFTSLRNRKTGKQMGGVATAVNNNLRQNTVKVGEGEGEDEYLITRVDHVYPAINIVNVYKGQESRMTTKEILENWLRLMKDVDDIMERGEGVVMIGDFNAAIGKGNLGVKENHERVSYRGKLINELLEEKEIFLVNSMEIQEKGPWTWESRSDPNKKSCLDLVMVSENLLPYLSSLLVDTRREYSPCRITKKQGRLVRVYSDHYTMVLSMKNLPRRKVMPAKQSNWNLKKPEGWEKYKSMTDEIREKADIIIDNHDLDIEKVMKEVDKLQDNVKFKAFGKTKPPRATGWLEKRDKDSTGLDDQEKAKLLLEAQSKKIEEEINKIKMMRNGQMAKIYKMREIIAGPKKAKHEAHAVRNKKGELVFSNEEIKKVNLEHCLETFKNKDPHEEAKLAVTIKEWVHEERMKEDNGDDFEITKEKFDDAVQELARKN